MIATSWLAPEAWREHQQDAIDEALRARPDWQEYLALVNRHRTPALSWTALKRTPGLNIPDKIWEELRKRDHACRLEALRRTAILIEVLKGLNQSKILPIPLKGPLLSLALFGDTGMRHSWDLDLMVAGEDVSIAAKCLEAMGWQLAAPYSSLSSLTSRQSEAFWRHEHHISYEHPQKGSLELHWSILPHRHDQTAGYWTRSVPSRCAGAQFRAMDSIDLTLYLCDHGCQHAWFRAKWLGDLARIYTIGFANWETVYDRALVTDCERPLLLCLALLEEAYGLRSPVLLQARARNVLPTLTAHVVRQMQNPAEPESHPAFARLVMQLRNTYYERSLRPRKPWRQILAELGYCLADHELLRLPDHFYWAYLPLRPVLWAWRSLLRSSR